MSAIDFILFNGRATGPKGLVRQTAHEAAGSSSENNGNNAWYCASGWTGYNNKNNEYAVRPVAALSNEIKQGWLEAFFDCCENKKNSADCDRYRAADWECDLMQLAAEVENRTYKPRPSTCFLVTKPKLREIFAADFRDRIVQHWICLRLEPLFERRFVEQGNVSHNCRKGFGTSSAINSLDKAISQISECYTRPAWVCKIDVQSFFMSIDTNRMWQLLSDFIRSEYIGDDIDTLLYLTEVTIKHRPQLGCIRKGALQMWEDLPRNKSLLHAPDGIGMAIGNITSQLQANFYMSHYVERIAPLVADLGGCMVQFVDDIAFVAPTKEACLTFRRESEKVLRDGLSLTLHPDKFYLQEVRKGIKFLGQVIKPGRRYIANRTLGGLTEAVRRTERLCNRIARDGPGAVNLRALDRSVASVNSYLGMAVHTASFNRRRRIFEREADQLWRFCDITRLRVLKIKKHYRLTTYLTQAIK